MMANESIFVSELSTSRHAFNKYHFCRGNSNRRKSRLGVVLKGSGTYIYLSKKLKVSVGDVVFIPENIYCYSEWYGDPEIEVVYVSCFMHYDGFCYEPQVVCRDVEMTDRILKISSLLSAGRQFEAFEAYSLFYKLLQSLLPQMTESTIAYDGTLQRAIEFLTNRWNKKISVAELAKACCVSESTVYHTFRKELGQTPIQFLNSIKINVAIEYLENSDYSISTISAMTGFASENHFRKVFSDLTGTTPLKFRKNR